MGIACIQVVYHSPSIADIMIAIYERLMYHDDVLSAYIELEASENRASRLDMGYGKGPGECLLYTAEC